MASSQPIGFSSGSPFLSLQELIKDPTFAVPPCYVRQDDEEPPFMPSDGIHPLPELPIIDMEHLVSGEAMDVELQKLHSASKEWGFFQLVNHGVGSSLIEKLKSEIKGFFNLPLEEKMKYKRGPGDIEGYGQTAPLSEDQKLDWGDRFYMVINPVHERKPHLLPEFPPSLRDTLESYFSELQKLAMKLLGVLAKALKMEVREMEETFEDGMQTVRMNYYPPCSQPERVIGILPHSDGSGITLLLQVNGVEGLQIKKNGVWVPVKFHPDSFVVNVGDILEILSNGVYRSVEHRVRVSSTNERVSIAIFFNPNLQAEVGPAKSLISPQNPPLFKRVSMQQYVENFFSRKLDRNTYLKHLRIENGEDDH